VGHPRPLGQRHEFDTDGDLVTGRVGLVGEGETVHDLSRPSVLDLQGLIVLQSLVREPPQHGDVLRRMKVVLERRPVGGSFQFISDIRVVQISPDGRGQVSRESKVEGEDVLAGFHGVVV
jgi:hypothetical protein